jgi:hypothetical protein
MPVLDLPQLHLPMAAAYLTIVMHCPRDPSKHQQMMEAFKLDVFRNIIRSRRLEGKEIPVYAMRAVTDCAIGPRIKDSVPNHLIATKYKIIRPEVAVLLFYYVLSCADAKDPVEPATLEHAREVIGDGRPGLGRSELIEIWQDFAPAVHLLAARTALKPLWDLCGKSGAALARFLAFADALRIRGEQHKVSRSKTTLLDPAETWTLPDWVVLPALPDDALSFPAPSALRVAIGNW